MNAKQLFRVAALLSLFAAAACQNATGLCIDSEVQECNPRDPTVDAQ